MTLARLDDAWPALSNRPDRTRPAAPSFPAEHHAEVQMPTLQITSSTKDLEVYAMSGCQLLATMLYPADSVTRDHVVGLFKAALRHHNQLELQEPILRALFQTYGWNETLWRRGWIPPARHGGHAEPHRRSLDPDN